MDVITCDKFFDYWLTDVDSVGEWSKMEGSHWLSVGNRPPCTKSLSNCSAFKDQSQYHRLVSQTEWSACHCDDPKWSKVSLAPSDFGTRYLGNDATYALDDCKTLTGNRTVQIEWYYWRVAPMSGSARNHVLLRTFRLLGSRQLNSFTETFILRRRLSQITSGNLVRSSWVVNTLN